MMSVKAALVLVGSEMTDPARPDANGPYAKARLAELGISIALVVRVEDRISAIAAAVADALAIAEVVLLSGGLGPTGDDLTREGVASALGLGIQEDGGWVGELQRRLGAMGRELTEAGRLQANIVEGAAVLVNPVGLACGSLLEPEGRLLALLPGVPREFRAMLDLEVLPRVAARFPERPRVRVVKALAAGLPEVKAEETLKPWYDKAGVAVSILPSTGVLRITFTLTGFSETDENETVRAIEQSLRSGLGRHLLSLEGKELEEVLGERLLEAKATLATAESLTGGLLGQKVVSVAGASRYYLGGIVAYSNEAKGDLLGVPSTTLEGHGAVSAETALAMARGVRARFLATWGVSTTGVAGPGGGSSEKPVGTVFVGIVGPGVEASFSLRFAGDRASIGELSANYALFHLWRTLLEAKA